jgi:hypothetical protein
MKNSCFCFLRCQGDRRALAWADWKWLIASLLQRSKAEHFDSYPINWLTIWINVQPPPPFSLFSFLFACPLHCAHLSASPLCYVRNNNNNNNKCCAQTWTPPNARLGCMCLCVHRMIYLRFFIIIIIYTLLWGIERASERVQVNRYKSRGQTGRDWTGLVLRLVIGRTRENGWFIVWNSAVQGGTESRERELMQGLLLLVLKNNI